MVYFSSRRRLIRTTSCSSKITNSIEFFHLISTPQKKDERPVLVITEVRTHDLPHPRSNSKKHDELNRSTTAADYVKTFFDLCTITNIIRSCLIH